MKRGANYSCPPSSFAKVIKRLRRIQPLGVIVVGGPVARPRVDEFLRSYGQAEAVIYHPPVGMLGGIMRKALLTLCNDTGIMHIAGGVGARCVAVFGPTASSRWKPAGENVVAVRQDDSRIESVTVEQAFSASRDSMGCSQPGQTDI